MTTENVNTHQVKAGADSPPSPCSAILWIHTHFETGEPVQVDVNEWHGRVDILDHLTDIKNLGDIEINVPLETWVEARIEVDLDDGHYYDVKILPNASDEPRPLGAVGSGRLFERPASDLRNTD